MSVFPSLYPPPSTLTFVPSNIRSSKRPQIPFTQNELQSKKLQNSLTLASKSKILNLKSSKNPSKSHKKKKSKASKNPKEAC